MRQLLSTFDAISEHTGRASAYLCPALVVILSYEVVMRYAFGHPTMWAHLTSMMVGGSIVCLGLAYTHLHKSHIRIDVIYTKLSRRQRALIDVVLTIVLLVPLLLAFMKTSFTWMIQSWASGEVRTESFWYPPAAPFRTVVFVGWVLFALQCLCQFVRDLYLLAKGESHA
ncbi:MAG: TRAP transporter small permease subunit [Candidatus Thorarchaeota archaeon]